MSINKFNSDLLNINNSSCEFFHINQNFNEMNIIETGPTTNYIHENIFEEDLSIIINELSNLYFKELNEGKESDIRKQHILDFIKNYKINLQEIIYWLSNNQHNSNSIHLLGYFYYYGIEVNSDKQNAYEYFKKAAELEHDTAQYNLVNMYIDGDGVDKNYDKAFKLCKKLAGKGCPSGINLLGYCYDIGIGTDIDKEKSFELYRNAADLGNLNGLNNLGICYEGGVGTNVNKQKAFESYQKATELGSTNGMTHLGWCYEEGFGTDVNVKKAFELYSKAANLKNKYAQYNLALMYEKGKGIEKNMEQAIYWYKKVRWGNPQKLTAETQMICSNG
ncbi:kinase-like domain-containing protein [Rhizophagus irregularis DAOM 181602=DAOM 197198]|nr:kinase-like domain-containing protein [Rhizophagus irregularis DAOM 181602=DAOM 197198]